MTKQCKERPAFETFGKMALLALPVTFGFAGSLTSVHAAPVPVTARYEVAAKYDGAQVSRLYVTSFDGTRLAITLHIPKERGAATSQQLPVIVQQANAAPQPEDQATIDYFTRRGYIWLSQARRGTGASFGVQTGFVNEADAKDAKAIIEWAGEQPFSSGKVVSFGCSNEGAWQYLALTHKPKHLVAASIQCASPALFDNGISNNGINFLPLPSAPYKGECGGRPGALPSPFRPFAEPLPVDDDKDGTLLSAARIQQRCNSDFLGQYWLNMARDSENAFAQNRPGITDTAIMQADAVRQSGVAILQIGGWFDAAVAGQFEGQRIWGGRVFMLPRSHGNQPIGFPNDSVDVNAESLRWFDHFAKGVNSGAADGVTYYTINAPHGGEWRQVSNWQSDIGKSAFYLTAEGLSRAVPDRTGEPVRYAPRQVKWFDGGYAAMHRNWSGDMAGADANSIVHNSPVLDRHTELTGTPVARLWISADQPDVNIYAVVEDVAPDGRSHYVTDGQLRASWRKLVPAPWGGSKWNWHRGYAKDIEALMPNKPTELVFDLYPTSYVFAKGHKIRVSITTSIGEAYHAPPMAEGRAATLTLLRDKAHASLVELPIVPANR